MAQQITTITEIPYAVNNYYDRKLLLRVIPKLVAGIGAQSRPLPANSTDVIKFRRYQSLPVATTALTEGTNPDGRKLSQTTLTAQVAQYGDYITITDKVELTAEDPVLNEGIDILADQMAMTVDTLTYSALMSGTNVMYANGAADRANLASAITMTDIDKAIRLMRRNNAKEFTEVIKATTGVATFPIRPAFWAFVHPDVVRDLENLTGFISVERYASTGPVHEAEVGAVKNVRFLMTTNLPTVDAAGNPAASTTWVAGATNTTKAVVYPTIIIAKDAYGTVGIDKGTVKSIVKVPGSQSTNDPLNMLTTAGWKTWFTAKILNDAWVCRIESLATA